MIFPHISHVTIFLLYTTLDQWTVNERTRLALWLQIPRSNDALNQIISAWTYFSSENPTRLDEFFFPHLWCRKAVEKGKESSEIYSFNLFFYLVPMKEEDKNQCNFLVSFFCLKKQVFFMSFNGWWLWRRAKNKHPFTRCLTMMMRNNGRS